jgi:hypothetical protein
MISLTRSDFLRLSFQGTMGLAMLPYLSACKSDDKAPAVDPKTGNILLMYKSSTEGLTPPLLLGVAMADNPQGP